MCVHVQVYNMFQEATNVSHSCPSPWRPAACYSALHHHQAATI